MSSDAGIKDDASANGENHEHVDHHHPGVDDETAQSAVAIARQSLPRLDATALHSHTDGAIRDSWDYGQSKALAELAIENIHVFIEGDLFGRNKMTQKKYFDWLAANNAEPCLRGISGEKMYNHLTKAQKNKHKVSVVAVHVYKYVLKLTHRTERIFTETTNFI
jgi:hypothetical protein